MSLPTTFGSYSAALPTDSTPQTDSASVSVDSSSTEPQPASKILSNVDENARRKKEALAQSNASFAALMAKGVLSAKPPTQMPSSAPAVTPAAPMMNIKGLASVKPVPTAPVSQPSVTLSQAPPSASVVPDIVAEAELKANNEKLLAEKKALLIASRAATTAQNAGAGPSMPTAPQSYAPVASSYPSTFYTQYAAPQSYAPVTSSYTSTFHTQYSHQTSLESSHYATSSFSKYNPSSYLASQTLTPTEANDLQSIHDYMDTRTKLLNVNRESRRGLIAESPRALAIYDMSQMEVAEHVEEQKRLLNYREERINELSVEVLELREYKQKQQQQISQQVNHELCRESNSWTRKQLEATRSRWQNAEAAIKYMDDRYAMVHPDLAAEKVNVQRLIHEKAKLRHELSVSINKSRERAAEDSATIQKKDREIGRVVALEERTHIKYTKLLEKTTGIPFDPVMPCTYTNYIVLDTTLPGIKTPDWLTAIFAWSFYIISMFYYFIIWSFQSLIAGVRHLFVRTGRSVFAGIVYVSFFLGRLILLAGDFFLSSAARVMIKLRRKYLWWCTPETFYVLVACMAYGTLVQVSKVVSSLGLLSEGPVQTRHNAHVGCDSEEVTRSSSENSAGSSVQSPVAFQKVPGHSISRRKLENAQKRAKKDADGQAQRVRTRQLNLRFWHWALYLLAFSWAMTSIVLERRADIHLNQVLGDACGVPQFTQAVHQGAHMSWDFAAASISSANKATMQSQMLHKVGGAVKDFGAARLARSRVKSMRLVNGARAVLTFAHERFASVKPWIPEVVSESVASISGFKETMVNRSMEFSEQLITSHVQKAYSVIWESYLIFSEAFFPLEGGLDPSPVPEKMAVLSHDFFYCNINGLTEFSAHHIPPPAPTHTVSDLEVRSSPPPTVYERQQPLSSLLKKIASFVEWTQEEIIHAAAFMDFNLYPRVLVNKVATLCGGWVVNLMR